jgi:hypothetical protein
VLFQTEKRFCFVVNSYSFAMLHIITRRLNDTTRSIDGASHVRKMAGKNGGRSNLRVSLVQQRSACGKSMDCRGGGMQGAQSRGDGLPSFACLSALCPSDCIPRLTQYQNRHGATRAAFVPVCILFVQASVLPPQLARGDMHSAALRTASQLRAQSRQAGLS